MAFENSFCQDYITEKFYRRGLMNEAVPIVMNMAEMDKIAPPHSHINIKDFESPKVREIFCLLYSNP